MWPVFVLGTLFTDRSLQHKRSNSVLLVHALVHMLRLAVSNYIICSLIFARESYMTDVPDVMDLTGDTPSAVSQVSGKTDPCPTASTSGSPESPNKYPVVDLPRGRVVDGTRNKKVDEVLARDVIRGGGVLVKGDRMEFWYSPDMSLLAQGIDEPQQTIAFSSTAPVPEDPSSSSGQSTPVVTVSKPTTPKKAAVPKKKSSSSASHWIKGTIISTNKAKYSATIDLDQPLVHFGKKIKSLLVFVKLARWKLVESVSTLFSGSIFQPRPDQKPSAPLERVYADPIHAELFYGTDFDASSPDMNDTRKEYFRARKADPTFKATYDFKYSIPVNEQAEMAELKKIERESGGALNRELNEKIAVIDKNLELRIAQLDEIEAVETEPILAQIERAKKSIDEERDTSVLLLESSEGRVSGTGQSVRVARKTIDDTHRSRTIKEVNPLEKKLSSIQSGYEKQRREARSVARGEIEILTEKRDKFIASIKERQSTLKELWKKMAEDDVSAMKSSMGNRLEKEWWELRKLIDSKHPQSLPNCSLCKVVSGWPCQSGKCDACWKFTIYEPKMEELELRVPWSNNRTISEYTPYHVFWSERTRELRQQQPNAELAVFSQICREEWKKMADKSEFEKKRRDQLLDLVDNLVEEEVMEEFTPVPPSGGTMFSSAKRSHSTILQSSADSSESESDEACDKCLSFKQPALILQCDRTEGENIDEDRVCGGMTHTYCCSPPLGEVPEGNWYCSKLCSWVERHKPAMLVDADLETRRRGGRSKKNEPATVIVEDDVSPDSPTGSSLTGVRLDVALGKRLRYQFLLSNWATIEQFLPDCEKVKHSLESKIFKLSAQLDSAGLSIGLAEKIASKSGITGASFPFTVTPPYVQAEMRPYQLDGLNWFITQHDKGANSIMADEMGLGKTLQTLSFFASLNHYMPYFAPFLVVCPLSVLPNWLAESKRWTPQLNVVGLFGPSQERERIKSGFEADRIHLIVTTYEILLTEINWLRSQFHFRYFVLDEAQKIKNTDALVTQACRQIRSVYRVLLTGTPLQNNMKELWSLLNFLYPEVFTVSSVSRFAQAYDSSTTSDDTSASMIKNDDFMRQCQTLLEPIMIRRLKQNVLAAHLPPKTEIVLTAPLSQTQQFHYRQVLKTVTGLVRNMGYKNVSSLLWQLWKCCLHPFLFDGVEEELISGGHAVDNKIVHMSGKMCLLDGLLAKLFEQQSKCLVYSQYTTMLDIIEEYCQWRGWKYLRLDGSTSLARRRFYMHQFNKPIKEGESFNDQYFVFLVSTKAGGVGVNLQSANSVILYDSSWNPFVDAQAEDRAHRMGQKKEVTVYRLITKDTCEERIRFFAQQKLKMKEHVLGEDANGEKTVVDDDLYSPDQLKDILEFGADKILESDEGGENGEKFYASCVDSLNEQLASADKFKQEAKTAKTTTTNKPPPLSPVKRNICIRKYGEEDYTQTKIERTTEMDWLDMMEESKTMVRNRKATTVTVTEAGVGKIQVSKWSIEEAEKEAEQAERERARIDAKKIAGGNKRVTEHDMNCSHCKESVMKQKVIVTTEIDEDGNQVKRRKIDTDNSGYVSCPICPGSFHMQCLRLAVHGIDPDSGSLRTSCPQHKCRLCRRSASNAGGLLFRCTDCPVALCYDCIEKYELVDQFEFLERENVVWETQLGFAAPSTYEYMKCPDCVTK
jgi:hypothetical protein